MPSFKVTALALLVSYAHQGEGKMTKQKQDFVRRMRESEMINWPIHRDSWQGCTSEYGEYIILYDVTWRFPRCSKRYSWEGIPNALLLCTVKRAMNLMRTTAAMKITTARTQMIAETMMIVAVHTIHPGRLLTMLILESKEKLWVGG